MSKKEVKTEEKKGTALKEMDLASPGGDIQAYINSVHSIGILTPEEEKKLAEIYGQDAVIDLATGIVTKKPQAVEAEPIK